MTYLYVVMKWQGSVLLIGGRHNQFDKAMDEVDRAVDTGDYTSIQVVRVFNIGRIESSYCWQKEISK